MTTPSTAQNFHCTTANINRPLVYISWNRPSQYVCDNPRPGFGPVLYGAKGVVSRVRFGFALPVDYVGLRLLDQYYVRLDALCPVKGGVVVRARTGAYVYLDKR